MSTKEPISILTASTKTHFIAIGIFAVLVCIFYVVAYTDQFKDIRNKVEKWIASIFDSKTSDKKDEIDDEIDDEIEDEIDDESTNVRDVLSPF